MRTTAAFGAGPDPLQSVLRQQPMALSPGTRLGAYDVVAFIGAGGMGEVYRARDIKLGRDVALKIVPEVFATDPDRLVRFTLEAQTLAALNHPYIAHIHGLEESNGVRALVMELVEGEDLARRIARGAISIDEALRIARQIAEALEAAQELGIVHRDLKPANIKVRDDGTVKVLDFGLAKALDPVTSSNVNATMSPNLSMQATMARVILGTAAYMAPEQASGKRADRRADVWSFGAVLYEMLAGKQAFAGESVSDTLATVLKLDSDWGALPSSTPASIRKLVRRCLTKDRKQRLQAIGEARIALESPQPELSELHEPTPVPLPSRLSHTNLDRMVTGVTVVVALALAAVAFVHFRETSPPDHTLRYTIAAPEIGLNSLAVSPDGRYVAIAAGASNANRQLWLRPLDALQAQPIPGTEGAQFPFWSPDSHHIGFFALDKLKRIAASGGPAQSLCNAPNGRGGSWNREDVIMFSANGIGQPGPFIQRVAAAGLFRLAGW